MVTCKSCNGRGQTKETATVMRADASGKLHTVQQGSGCPECLGTGLVAQQRAKVVKLHGAVM